MCPDCKTTKKTSLILILVVMVIAGVVGSGVLASGEHDHKKHEMSGEHSKMKHKEHKMSDASNKQSIAALEVYEDLHAAFFNYDNKKVLKISKRLADKLSAISDKSIQKKIKDKNIIKYLKSMKLSENRSTNNSLFHVASKGIFESLVSGSALSKSYGQYYCPMVNKTWIQNSVKVAEVRNPYAPGMKSCGEAR